MFRNITLTAASTLALTMGSALAGGKAPEIEDVTFAHEGPFGTFDRLQLQRGLQVYTETCAACHGLKYVPIRTLADETGPMLPEDQVRAFAAAFPIADEESNRHLFDIATGEFRALVPTDNFPAHYLAAAPDLSLMAKARAGFKGPYGSGMNQLFRGMGGAEYIHGLLVGFVEPPACAEGYEIDGNYNSAFMKGAIPETCKDEAGNSTIPGSWINMPSVLSEGVVTYADGTPATVEQMSMDVSSFLMWAAEPKLVARREAGFTAVLFLIVLASLLYLTNKRLWAGVKGKGKG